MKIAESLRAADLIRKHCKLVDGFAVWDTGWSDDSAALALGIKSDQVRHIRTAIVGKKYQRATAPGEIPTHTEERADRTDEIMSRLRLLENAHTALRKEYGQLADSHEVLQRKHARLRDHHNALVERNVKDWQDETWREFLVQVTRTAPPPNGRLV